VVRVISYARLQSGARKMALKALKGGFHAVAVALNCAHQVTVIERSEL
jgi:hypothetical protein